MMMLLSCIGVSVYATSYFLFTPRDDHFSRYILPLRLHIAGGMGALLAGPWQFSEKLRARALNFHRWLGRFYLSEVALGSIAGFALTLAAVTLRNYMPLMLFVLHCPFSDDLHHRVLAVLGSEPADRRMAHPPAASCVEREVIHSHLDPNRCRRHFTCAANFCKVLV